MPYLPPSQANLKIVVPGSRAVCLWRGGTLTGHNPLLTILRGAAGKALIGESPSLDGESGTRNNQVRDQTIAYRRRTMTDEIDAVWSKRVRHFCDLGVAGLAAVWSIVSKLIAFDRRRGARAPTSGLLEVTQLKAKVH